MKQKINRPQLESRMAEYLGNWQAEKESRPMVVGNGRAKYDWTAKRKARAEMAAHKKNFGLSSKARENYDRIFRG